MYLLVFLGVFITHTCFLHIQDFCQIQIKEDSTGSTWVTFYYDQVQQLLSGLSADGAYETSLKITENDCFIIKMHMLVYLKAQLEPKAYSNAK
jgi:hypothetical protein